MATADDDVRQYVVPADVFKEIYNFDSGKLQGQQSGWRKFYSQFDIKVVTRSNRVNKRSINITGKHSRAEGCDWCPTSYNFNIKLPIDRNASEVTFHLTINHLDRCDCGKIYCNCCTIYVRI